RGRGGRGAARGILSFRPGRVARAACFRTAGGSDWPALRSGSAGRWHQHQRRSCRFDRDLSLGTDTMTQAGRFHPVAARPDALLRRTAANLAAFTAVLARPELAGRTHAGAAARSRAGRLAIGSGLAAAAVAGAMLFLDSWVIAHHGSMPIWLVSVFGEIT